MRKRSSRAEVSRHLRVEVQRASVYTAPCQRILQSCGGNPRRNSEWFFRLAPSNETMPRPCRQDGAICMLLPVNWDLLQAQRLLSFIHHAYDRWLDCESGDSLYLVYGAIVKLKSRETLRELAGTCRANSPISGVGSDIVESLDEEVFEKGMQSQGGCALVCRLWCVSFHAGFPLFYSSPPKRSGRKQNVPESRVPSPECI